MTPKPAGPLSRSVNVERLPKDRAEIVVEANPAECEALARDFKVPAIRDLVGRFTLTGSLTRLHADNRALFAATRQARIAFGFLLERGGLPSPDEPPAPECAAAQSAWKREG